jgi:CubicO group peptidase (beta-lactamase class C family)
MNPHQPHRSTHWPFRLLAASITLALGACAMDARQPEALPFGSAVSIMKDERIWAATGGQFHRGIVRLGASGRLYLVAVALQLVDEGRLALDARIDRYVNAWPAVRGVTVRQLMDGSSGVASFGDPIEDLARSVASDPQRAWSVADALAIAAGKQPRFAPGTRHEPADTEDALLDEIIEAITGGPSSDAITTRILEPIALEKTFVAGAPIPPPNMPQLNPTGELATEVQSGLWDPDGTGTLAIVPDLPAGVLAILGSARGMASSETDLARGTDALRSNPALLSESARAELARSIEDGGFGGAAMDYVSLAVALEEIAAGDELPGAA